MITSKSLFAILIGLFGGNKHHDYFRSIVVEISETSDNEKEALGNTIATTTSVLNFEDNQNHAVFTKSGSLRSSENALSSIHHSTGTPNTIEDLGFLRDDVTSFTAVTRNLVGSNWTQLGTDITGEAIDDVGNFGYAVAMSGDGKRIAAGASSYSSSSDGMLGSSDEDQGLVRVCEWNGVQWQQVGNDLIDEVPSITFVLSENGNRLAVGSQDEASRGQVRVYEYNGSAWFQIGSEMIGDKENDYAYRISLSSDGIRLAIGASGYTRRKGQVRVFDWNDTRGDWILVTTFSGKQRGEAFGSTVSLSADGSKLGVGSIKYGGKGVKDAGRVQVYALTSGAKVGEHIVGQARGANFGKSLSLSKNGNRLAIGSNGGKGSSGEVQVFDLENDGWTQVGLNLIGDDEKRRFEYLLALSTNGKRLAIGESGSGNKDYIKVLDWNGVNSTWDQAGHTITGVLDKGNGGNVALSTSGRKLAIGAPGRGNGAGIVKVFSDSTLTGTYGATSHQISEPSVNLTTHQISEPSVNVTSASEYVATYCNSKKGTYKFQITQPDCETTINNTPITLLNEVYEFNHTNQEDLSITISLNLTMLAGDSTIYTLSKDEIFSEIRFCITVEFHKDPSTVNLFHNTNGDISGYVAYRSTVIRATLDLSQEFEGSVMVQDVTTADLPDQLNPELKVDSYICDEDGSEIQLSTPLQTDEAFYFCVDITSLEYVKIDSIQELKFRGDGEWDYHPISEGKPRSDKELIEDPKFSTDRQKGIIHLYYLPVVLFDSSGDKFKVLISGTVKLTFGSRLLEIEQVTEASFENAHRKDRGLQLSSDQALFESVIHFTKNDTTENDRKQADLYAGATIGSVLVVGVALMIFLKRWKFMNSIISDEACDPIEVWGDSSSFQQKQRYCF